MARDSRLSFSFPAQAAVVATHILQTATTGVITLSGAADSWQRGTSTALNVGGFTAYSATGGPVPPGTEAAASGATTLTGNMGSEWYVTATVAETLTIATNGFVTLIVEGATDNAGAAGTDWAPVSAGYNVPADLAASGKRVNLQLTDTSRPWLRLALMVYHPATTANTGTVTITNAAFSLGRDGVNATG